MVSTNETNIHLWPAKSKTNKDALLLEINKYTHTVLDLRSLNVEDLKAILAWFKKSKPIDTPPPTDARLKQPMVSYIKTTINVGNLNRLSVPTLKDFSRILYEYANKSPT